MNPSQPLHQTQYWEHLPSPLWSGNRSGECLEANPALGRFLKLPKESLLGRQWLQFIPEPHRSKVLQTLANHGHSRRTFKTRIPFATGDRIKTLTLCVSILPEAHEGQSTVHAAIISERWTPPQRTREKFRRETLRLCFEHAPVGIGFLDLNLQFLQSNPALERLLNSPQPNLEPRTLREALELKLPAVSAAEIERACTQTLQTGTPHALHGWPLGEPNSSGQQKITDWELRRIQTLTQKPVGLILTVSDVTQQKLMQERLRLLASVLESTTDFVAVLSLEGNVLYLNHSARLTAGLAPDTSVHTLHISDLQPAWVLEKLQKEGFPSAIQEGTWEQETAFIQADGTLIPVSQILCAHKNPSGQVEFLSTILRDITDALDIRKQLADAREALEERIAERSAELAKATALIEAQVRQQTEAANQAKNAFLSRMSHELRTPLNAILGFAQLLKLEAPTSAQLESISHITRAGRHLLSLINEVLDITHIEAGRLALTMAPLEINSFLGNCVALMQPIADSRTVKLEFVESNAPVYVRGDRQRLKQVVLNFISNAIKYNHTGGLVMVSFTPFPSAVRFEVRDTGPGVPADKLNRLFKPFERLGAESSNIEGTGIGLALCKGLIDAMGGTIGFETPQNGGALFWAELPRADAAEQPERRLQKLPPSLAHDSHLKSPSALKVLAIESHDLDLHLLESLLQRQRPECELLSAMQGDLGLELAREHHPQVLLLDVALPDLSPEKFLSQLLALNPSLRPRIILMGTEEFAPELQRLSEVFHSTILLKPYDPDELLEHLRP